MSEDRFVTVVWNGWWALYCGRYEVRRGVYWPPVGSFVVVRIVALDYCEESHRDHLHDELPFPVECDDYRETRRPRATYTRSTEETGCQRIATPVRRTVEHLRPPPPHREKKRPSYRAERATHAQPRQLYGQSNKRRCK
jgi:hypothetical protein